MESQKEHRRQSLIFLVPKEHISAEAHKELCQVNGRDLTLRTCWNWFREFNSGDFSPKDEHSSGQPHKVDEEHIQAMIDKDRHATVWKIAE